MTMELRRPNETLIARGDQILDWIEDQKQKRFMRFVEGIEMIKLPYEDFTALNYTFGGPGGIMTFDVKKQLHTIVGIALLPSPGSETELYRELPHL